MRTRQRARTVLLGASVSCAAGLAALLVPGAGPAGAVDAAAHVVPVAPSALPLAGRTIVVDPGHQLGNSTHPDQVSRQVWVGVWKACNTTGTATDAGFPEATFTWRTAQALSRRLQALGATVVLTRDTNSRADWGPCVGARGRLGAAVGADLCIVAHPA